ncbi:MAG: hypothetical protein LLG04_02785 [Parachlamydia sp.]|nr:hypothetical protein [Parachlamydia sp.]
MEPLSSKVISPKQMDQLATQALLQHGDEERIMNQLALFPPGTFTRTNRSQRSIASIQEVISLLPTVDKITALVKSVGIVRTCELLPLLPEQSRFEEHSDEIHDFLSQLHTLMDGVVDCHSLSSLRVMRMLMFAYVQKWQRDMAQEKNYPLAGIRGTHVEKDCTPAQMPKSIEKVLEKIFMQLDLQTDFSDAIPELQGSLRHAKIYCDNYLSLWADKPDRQQRAEEAKLMLGLLELLEKAGTHYWLYMPLLQMSIAVATAETKRPNDRRVDTWLQSFLTGFNNQTASVMILIKDILIKEKSFSKEKEAFSQAEAELDKLDKVIETAVRKTNLASVELQQFSNLPPTAQHSLASQLSRIASISAEAVQHLSDSTKQYAKCVEKMSCLTQAMKKKWNREISNKDWANQNADSNMRCPWHYLRILVEAVLKDVQQSHLALSQLHDHLENLLPSKYRSLAHVSPIDMLEFELANSYHQWSQDPLLDDEKKKALKNFYDQYMNLIDAMRRRYRMRDRSEHVSENEIDFDGLIRSLTNARSAVTSMKCSFADRCQQAAQVLSLVCIEGNSWKSIFRNPFAGQKKDSQLEEQFFCDLTMLLRRRFLSEEVLQPIKDLETHRKELQDAKIAQQIRCIVNQLSSHIQKAQRALQNRVDVCPDNFMEETRLFWDKIASCGAALEEGVTQVELLLQQKNQPAAQKISELLSHLKSRYQRDFFSLGQSLYQKYQEREWIEAEEENRLLREERKKRRTAPIRHKIEKPEIPAPIEPLASKHTAVTQSAPLQVPQAETLDGSLLAFETICREFIPLCRFFEQTSTQSEHLMRTRLQHDSATNLLESLPVIRELAHGLKKHGTNSYFAHLLHLKLAVLLEQASILTASILNIYTAPGESEHALFLNQGRECFWERHSPIQLAKTISTHLLREALRLNEKKEMLLSKEQLALLQSFDRTIAVTSRKPHSGADSLTGLLQNLDDEETDETQREQYRQELKATFTQSLKTVSTLLQPVYHSTSSPKPSLSTDAIKACLTTFPESEGLSKEEGQSTLNSLEERLHRLQQHLAIPDQRQVPAIHKHDHSMARRVGTIWSTLNDLIANLTLSRNLLLDAEDPALCLATAESSLLNQSSILEGVLLIVLSHLPCRASSSSLQHFLWQEEKGKRPPRYRHALESFAQSLPEFLKTAKVEREEELFQKTIASAQALGGYLRSSYRYYNENNCQAAVLRDKLKLLSILRDGVVHESLSSIDLLLLDDCLGIKESSKRLERLDQHIAQVIRQEIKLPLLRMLELADEWLDVYEELLHRI